MFMFLQKRLELKIIAVLTTVVACAIGLYAYFDIQTIRADMIRTSERTLGTFAAAIKGSVIASMKEGQHEIVKHVLKEVNTPNFIDRVMIYDETGRPLSAVEKLTGDSGLDMTMPPAILGRVARGDISDIREQRGGYFISYYAPIENQPECYRCHGPSAKLNGILRVDFSLRDLDDLVVLRRTRVILWSAVLIILLIAVLMVMLRSVVYRPVKELRDAMAMAEQGIEPHALSLSGYDELAELKKSFVQMLGRIQGLHRTNLEKEKELARSQEMARFRAELQAMFDAMPDGVLLVDNSLRIVQSNPRVRELLQVVGDPDGRIPPDSVQDPSGVHFGIRQALDSQRISEHHCSVTSGSGEVRHVHSISAPIIENAAVLYVVEVIRDVTDRVRTERELAERKAQLQSANKLLTQIAVTDSLTQLFNRRHFDELLYKEVKRFNRRKYSHLSLMMIDIDHFKALNDRYGHLAGDGVLREVATLLKEGVRETDTVARYGGEEFVIVMPDTHSEGAARKAELLRRKVNEHSFPGGDAQLSITISIGVAAYFRGLPYDLVAAADTALYQAKHGGRNMVVLAPTDNAPELTAPAKS